jgi:major membrane immunogen (membrane-anchored lipoprotein)
MSVHKIPFMVLTLLSLLVACSKNDREEAAKNDDGVATFRFQPGDRTKYRKKDDKNLPQPTSASSGQSTGSAPSSASPTAPRK